MAQLNLSVAVGDYDRTRPLIDGSVQIDGVDPVYMTLPPEEIFFRAFRQAEFDICELSLSSLTVKTVQGDCPYVGVPEYQLTANVWARAILEDDHGVKPSDIHWIRAGIEEPGRPEKITVKLPDGIRLDNAREGATISRMLADGEIDGFIAPRPPTLVGRHPHIGWLFPDPIAAAKDYFKRTRIFPIMHATGVRRELVERHPWLPAAVLKAFEQAKAVALAKLSDTSATKVTLPFVEEQLKAARELMGEDFWAYGVEPNRKTLETFLQHHHAQGLSSRLVKVEELFHPSTHETFKL